MRVTPVIRVLGPADFEQFMELPHEGATLPRLWRIAIWRLTATS